VIAFNAQQSLIRVPIMPANIVRARAVAGYAALGNAAKNNVPALVQIMKSETSPQVRCCVASALGGIGPCAKAAIPVLLEAAQDTDAEVRKDAILALANIRSWAEPPGGAEFH
jgi:HEAT repeat protein